MQRRVACLMLASALLLAACGGKEGSGGAGGGADPFVGRWRAVTEHGSSELTLERRGDAYVLRAENEQAEARRVGARVEGDVNSPEGVLRFAFELRGDLLAARYTVLVPQGEPLELPEVVYGRVGPQTGGGGGGGSAGAGDVPSAMAGHWRHTEALSSGGVSLVTDTHLVLHADGTCSTWSHSEGVASGREPESPGRWRTQGDQLLLKADAGGDWTSVGRFVFDGTRLMLVRPNGDKQVYERL
jgi:hypothetical protein